MSLMFQATSFPFLYKNCHSESSTVPSLLLIAIFDSKIFMPHAITGATLHIDPGLRLAETVRRVCLLSALKAKLMEFVILTYNCHLCS